MRNIPNKGSLFIASAIAVTVATSSLLLIAIIFVVRLLGVSASWSFAFDRYFEGTHVAIFAGSLLFFLVSVVRCFTAHAEPFAGRFWLMFVAGLFYSIVLGGFGFVVLLVAKVALGLALPFWSIWPIGFGLLIALRLVFSTNADS